MNSDDVNGRNNPNIMLVGAGIMFLSSVFFMSNMISKGNLENTVEERENGSLIEVKLSEAPSSIGAFKETYSCLRNACDRREYASLLITVGGFAIFTYGGRKS